MSCGTMTSRLYAGKAGSGFGGEGSLIFYLKAAGCDSAIKGKK